MLSPSAPYHLPVAAAQATDGDDHSIRHVSSSGPLKVLYSRHAHSSKIIELEVRANEAPGGRGTPTPIRKKKTARE